MSDHLVGRAREHVAFVRRGDTLRALWPDLAGDDVHAMQRAVFTPFAPNKIVLHRPRGNAASIIAIAPFTKEQQPIGNKPTAYICTNYLCKLPTTDATKIGALMTTKR